MSSSLTLMPFCQNAVRRLAVVGLMSVAVAACGGGFEFSSSSDSPTDVAIELIQGDAMAQRLGVDTMTSANCDEPAEIEVGATFSCTADSGGETVNFTVTIDGEDQVFASPTNVIDRSLLGDYAASAVEILNDKAGLSLPADVMDCGTRSAVLDENQQMICLVTDPATGDTFDAELTITDQARAAFTVKIVVPGE